ncbi:MAG: hypothetical protein PHV30_04975 [Candidatus Margulisbacteria bacterium]|nr:hypothetical protein [Candidatus Margulisiibacteriota bacterium]
MGAFRYFQKYLVACFVLATSITLCLDFTQSADIHFRYGFGSNFNDGNQVFSMDRSYYTFNLQANNHTSTVVKLNLNTSSNVNNLNPDFINNAYVQIGHMIIGKQTIPFGSYTNRGIADPFSRTFEEIVRAGISSQLDFNQILFINGALVNNGVNDSMTAAAMKISLMPKKEYLFQQSVFIDQENNNGSKVYRVDIHGMVSIAVSKAILDLEVYRCLFGNNKNAMTIDASLLVSALEDMDTVLRISYANSVAATVLNKSVSISAGLNYHLNSNLILSFEGAYISKPANTSAINMLSMLSINF